MAAPPESSPLPVQRSRGSRRPVTLPPPEKAPPWPIQRERRVSPCDTRTSDYLPAAPLLRRTMPAIQRLRSPVQIWTSASAKANADDLIARSKSVDAIPVCTYPTADWSMSHVGWKVGRTIES